MPLAALVLALLVAQTPARRRQQSVDRAEKAGGLCSPKTPPSSCTSATAPAMTPAISRARSCSRSGKSRSRAGRSAPSAAHRRPASGVRGAWRHRDQPHRSVPGPWRPAAKHRPGVCCPGFTGVVGSHLRARRRSGRLAGRGGCAGHRSARGHARKIHAKAAGRCDRRRRLRQGASHRSHEFPSSMPAPGAITPAKTHAGSPARATFPARSTSRSTRWPDRCLTGAQGRRDAQIDAWGGRCEAGYRSCGVPHRSSASQVYMAGQILGLRVRLYDGSFEEWSAREELPVEKGIKKSGQFALQLVASPRFSNNCSR